MMLQKTSPNKALGPVLKCLIIVGVKVKLFNIPFKN